MSTDSMGGGGHGCRGMQGDVGTQERANVGMDAGDEVRNVGTEERMLGIQCKNVGT